ncbi:MAG: A/G-specific adenine glycosylase [Alphaproteobacteria bacterium]
MARVPRLDPDSAHKTVPPRLVRWYGRAGRSLPWRARGAERPDPYRVWLSEIMLQQTTVATVGPYFRAFTARWPRVEDLAAASLDEVLAAWAGLGYYARARNLHACAKTIVADHGGDFPGTEAGLRELPGIGPYTASAIAAIAVGRRASVVDGNVERVIARLFAVETPLPAAKAVLRGLAAGLLPEAAPARFPFGDYAQAMMDLGATVCLPRRPRCAACPLAKVCAAHAAGLAEDLPRRAPKKARPTRRGVIFRVVRPDGAILLRRRPERGLLGAMMELPSTDWREAPWAGPEALAQAPLAAGWTELPGLVRHTFTHFYLELRVWAGSVSGTRAPEAGRWVRPGDLDALALPTLMRKAIRHALETHVFDGHERVR